MTYLIGGPPRCGKTIVAQKLAEELGISPISTDTLETAVIAATPTAEFQEKFPKAVMREKTHNSNDVMYSQYSAEEIVAAYRQQATTIADELRQFVETKIQNDEDSILEGHHLAPQLVRRLQESHPDNTRSVMLIRRNASVIEQSTKEFAGEGDWVTGKTGDEETYPKIAAMLQRYGEQLEQEATELGIEVINMDGDFQESVGQAVDSLQSSSAESARQ